MKVDHDQNMLNLVWASAFVDNYMGNRMKGDTFELYDPEEVAAVAAATAYEVSEAYKQWAERTEALSKDKELDKILGAFLKFAEEGKENMPLSYEEGVIGMIDYLNGTESEQSDPIHGILEWSESPK